MPFVRVSRDKRGYETIYLVHTSQRRGRPGGTRVLYVFRTPPGVKVGRDPFDTDVRRTLEAQHPGVEFDWAQLSKLPAPPPDVEHWRERRRAEKAARLARKAEEAEEVEEPLASENEVAHQRDDTSEVEVTDAGSAPLEAAAAADTAPVAAAAVEPDRRAGRRRRRRRGGRPKTEPGASAPVSAAPAACPEPSDPKPDTREAAGDDGEDVA